MRIVIRVELFDDNEQRVSWDDWALDRPSGVDRVDSGHPAYVAIENGISEGFQKAEEWADQADEAEAAQVSRPDSEVKP
jgi:hypothetical protein